MNSDDPNPVKKGDKRRVEQLSFPKIFDSLLDTKGKLDSTMYDAVDKLKKITPDGGKIYARTKTPYSIINKLIDSRMITPKDPKKGLTDMVGTTIVVDNTDQVFAVQKEIENGALGEIVPEGVDKNGKVILADNKYENPKGGYRAIHYIIMMDGIPVEVQLKTKRMKEINELAHPHYKAKNLNSDFMEYLTSLADKGDRGDKKAQAEFNRIMRNKKDVSEKLKMDRTYMYAHGGRVQEIYGDEMELDGIFEDFKD
jgi:ppGpp synthetase/RelA/SpoT-type nucleotidyltranferase